MFTTGSKFLIGAAVLATLSAIAYGVTCLSFRQSHFGCFMAC